VSKASFPFEPGGRRSRDEPTDDATRLVWLLVMLLRRRIDFDAYCRTYEMHKRTYRRDIQKLRAIEKRCDLGFTIRSLGGSAYALETRARGLATIGDADRAVIGLIQELCRALGGPIEEALRGYDGRDERDRFLRIGMPRPVEGAEVAIVYRKLREAANASARVQFIYRSAPNKPSEREVEPYFIRWNSGRYYLVGYDTIDRDWRPFALDAFQDLPRRAGTFKPRIVPARYQSDDAIGSFKSGKPSTLRVELSPAIAAEVTGQKWQLRQVVTRLANGGALITLEDCDLDEVVR